MTVVFATRLSGRGKVRVAEVTEGQDRKMGCVPEGFVSVLSPEVVLFPVVGEDVAVHVAGGGGEFEGRALRDVAAVDAGVDRRRRVARRGQRGARTARTVDGVVDDFDVAVDVEVVVGVRLEVGGANAGVAHDGAGGARFVGG
jgi:hypothetical protein